MSLITYSPEEVAAQFRTDSDRWLRRGVQAGKYPHLRVARQIRFTEEHVKEIAAQLERKQRQQQAPVNRAVFNTSRRSRRRT